MLCVKWNQTGSAIASVGEDGQVKVWSPSGMLRTQLGQHDVPVYACAWSPDSESIAYSQGRHMMIKALQPGIKDTAWKAHEGLVLNVLLSFHGVLFTYYYFCTFFFLG